MVAQILWYSFRTHNPRKLAFINLNDSTVTIKADVVFSGLLHYEDKIPIAEFEPATISTTGKMSMTTKPWEIIWDLTFKICYAKKWLTNNASVYWSLIDKLQNPFHRLKHLQMNKQVWKKKEFINKAIRQVIWKSFGIFHYWNLNSN